MSISKTFTLGGTASGIVVAKVAHGLMSMTLSGNRPDEETFAAIKASLDAVPDGVKMILNSGEFYGHQLSTSNLELVARFFEQYPEYTSKAFLSVKGGLKARSFEPDSSPENLRRSIDLINETLRGTKTLDLFECARVDSKYPIEETVKELAKLSEEGKFAHLGLSECSAETLRRANAVHPVAIVEIEISPWSYEEQTKKVIATASELGIAVLGYSPLGRGFLTGQIKSVDDLPEGDFRRRLTRFQGDEIIKANWQFVELLQSIGTKINATSGQISIAWVSSLGPHVIPLPGSSKQSRTLENIGGGEITLGEADLEEINKGIASIEVKGDRYYGADEKEMHLWG